jgi:hypothetical protein
MEVHLKFAICVTARRIDSKMISHLLHDLRTHEGLYDCHDQMEKWNGVEDVNFLDFNWRTILHEGKKFLHRSQIVSQQVTSVKMLHVIKKNKSI